MRSIILASGSKDRKEILERANVPFQIFPIEIDEEQFKLKISDGVKLVKKLAKLKLLKAKEQILLAAEREKNTIIIAADTIVEFHNEIIGKASNRGQAFQFLKKLQGKSHKLITGIAVASLDDPRIMIDYDVTIVEFCTLSDREINNYLDCYEWKGRAGAYSIRDKASIFIKSINGSPSNVIGLPMQKLFSILKNEFKLNLIDY